MDKHDESSLIKLFLFSVIVGSHKYTNAIDYDNPEKPTPFSWKVPIEQAIKTIWDSKIYCEGILISNRHVLAPASCFLHEKDLVTIGERPR